MARNTSFNVITRNRLVNRIGLAVDTLAPLTLLHAHRGYGKTTLLQQWQDSFDPGGIPVYTAQMPAEDSHATIWRAICIAVGVQVPTSSARLQLRLLAGWAARLTKPTVVVIDNYESFTSAEVDDATTELLSLNKNLYMVISGRWFARLTGPLSRARVETNVVDADLLAFDSVDLRNVSESNGGFPHVGASYAAWPLALAASIRADPSAEQQAILDLAQQIFQQEDGETEKKVLFALARIGSTTGNTLAPRLGLSAEEFAAVAERLLKKGLIRREPYASGLWFSMPEPVRAVLSAEPLPEHTGCQFADFLAEHADLIADKDPIGAMGLFIETGRLARAEVSVVNNFGAYARNAEKLAHLLGKVDIALLVEHPVLLGLRLLADGGLGEPSLDGAEHHLVSALENAENQQAARATVLETLLMVAERKQGGWAGALQRARSLERKLVWHADHGIGQDDGGLSSILSAIALTGILGGDFGLAQRSTTRAAEVSATQNDFAEQIQAHRLTALTCALQRPRNQTHTHLEDAMGLMEAHGLSPEEPLKISQELARGLNAVGGGNLQEAQEALSTIMPAARETELWPVALLLQSHVQAEGEGAGPALHTLQQELVANPRAAQISPHFHALISARLASLAILEGHLRAAETILGQADGTEVAVALAWGHLRLFQHDFAGAYRIFQEMRSRVVTTEGEVETTLLGALAAYQMGDQQESTMLLRWAKNLMPDHEAVDILRPVPFNFLLQAAQSAERGGVEGLSALVEQIPIGARVYALDPLSDAEMDTLRGLKSGLTLTELASKTGLSQNTLKFHRTNVYRKLQVSSKREALQKAEQMGLWKVTG